MSNIEYFSADIGPICLKNCIFCSEGGFGKREGYTNLDKFKKIILENKPKKVSLSGGEPLLNKDLLEYIYFCKNLKIEVSLVTAWEVGFGKEFILKLINSGLNELMISLEGNEQIHDLLTCKKGSYKNIISILYELKKIEKKNLKIIINTNLNKLNYKILPSFIDKILRNFNFISIYHIQMLEPLGKAIKYKNILFDKYSILIYPLIEKIGDIKDNYKIKFGRLPYCFLKEEKYKYLSKTMNNFYKDEKNNIFQKHVLKNRYISKKCTKCTKLKFCDLPYPKYIEIFGENEIKTINKKEAIIYHILDRDILTYDLVSFSTILSLVKSLLSLGYKVKLITNDDSSKESFIILKYKNLFDKFNLEYNIEIKNYSYFYNKTIDYSFISIMYGYDEILNQKLSDISNYIYSLIIKGFQNTQIKILKNHFILNTQVQSLNYIGDKNNIINIPFVLNQDFLPQKKEKIMYDIIILYCEGFEKQLISLLEKISNKIQKKLQIVFILRKMDDKNHFLNLKDYNIKFFSYLALPDLYKIISKTKFVLNPFDTKRHYSLSFCLCCGKNFLTYNYSMLSCFKKLTGLPQKIFTSKNEIIDEAIKLISNDEYRIKKEIKIKKIASQKLDAKKVFYNFFNKK